MVTLAYEILYLGPLFTIVPLHVATITYEILYSIVPIAGQSQKLTISKYVGYIKQWEPCTGSV